MLRRLAIALCGLLIASTCHAQLLLRGYGAGGFGSSPPPVVYAPAGMEFQRDTTVGATASLGVGSPTAMTVSFWIWGGYTQTGVDGNLQNNPTQFKTVRTSACELVASAHGKCFAWDNSAAWPQLSFASAAGGSGVRFAGQSSLGGGFVIGQWNHYLLSFDTVSGAYGLMVNNVDVIANGAMVLGQMDASVAVDISNAAGWGMANWGAANAHVYEAEVYEAAESIACTAAGTPFGDCTGAHTLSPGKVAKFVTGSGATLAPVDLGPTCALPTGNQPYICLTGDSTTMLTNKGTAAPAGGFTAQATTTFATTFSYVNDPPYGPAGPTAHVAYEKWHTPAAALGIQQNISVLRGDFTVTAGDLLIAYAAGNDASGVLDHAMACPTGGANTWHAFSGAPLLTAVGSLNGIACWTIAQVGDTTGPWTITSNASFSRQTGFSLHDYGNVASVDSATCAAVAASTTATTPANTTSGAGETIIGAIISRNGGTGTYSAPSVGTTRERTVKTGTRHQIMVWDRMNVAAGTTTQANVTLGTSEATIGCAIALVPS